MTTINTKSLIRELEWIARFVESKSTIPTLKTVRFDATSKILKLSATNLEIGAITFVPAAGLQWSTCVSVSRLLKYLKKVEEPEVQLKPLPLNAGLQLLHGRDAGVTVCALSPDSFPVFHDVRKHIGTISGLGTALPRVITAIAAEDSRFSLNGALLDTSTKTPVLVATDGHRLSIVEVSCDLPATKLLIPKEALYELQRLVTDDSPLRIAASEDHIRFVVDSRQIIARRLTGNFPDYQRVLPNAEHSVDLNVPALHKILNRVAIFANTRNHATVWNIEHAQLAVSASEADTGSARGCLKLPTNGVTWQTGLNAEYVSDCLKQMPDSCTFQFNDANSAVQFSTDGWKYVVMPIRI